jgi:carboxymethylenebutenolidase
MPITQTQIHVPDGAFAAHLARPEGLGPFPGVVVIQEIFGVNHVVREICAALANEGYLAVAPDLFWRIEPGIDITDRTEAEWNKAFALFKAVDIDKAVDDIQATLTWVRKQADCTGRVGAIGHCLGGKLAYLSATRTDADASVGYYGVGIESLLDEADRIQQPLMLHIAEADGFVPPEAQAEIKAVLGANPHVTLYSYPGRDHAFARPGGQNFNPADAGLANDRTMAFLKRAQL